MGSQSATLANNNFYKSGSRRGNLLISSIRSILYAPIAIMTVSREAVCIFWPRSASNNNRFTARSSICSRLYAPIDNNNGFAWSCLHSLAKTMVSRGAVCIFLLKQRFRVELFAFSCYNRSLQDPSKVLLGCRRQKMSFSKLFIILELHFPEHPSGR